MPLLQFFFFYLDLPIGKWYSHFSREAPFFFSLNMCISTKPKNGFNGLYTAQLLIVLLKNGYSYSYLVSKFASSPSSSTFFANTSTCPTMSISWKTKLAIARPSSFFRAPSLEGDIRRFSSSLFDCNLDTIRNLGLHFLIVLMLSPSSLRDDASEEPSSSHCSLIDCLRVDEGWWQI